MAYTIDKVGGEDRSKHAEILGKSTGTKPTDVKINESQKIILTVKEDD